MVGSVEYIKNNIRDVANKIKIDISMYTVVKIIILIYVVCLVLKSMGLMYPKSVIVLAASSIVDHFHSVLYELKNMERSFVDGFHERDILLEKVNTLESNLAASNEMLSKNDKLIKQLTHELEISNDRCVRSESYSKALKHQFDTMNMYQMTPLKTVVINSLISMTSLIVSNYTYNGVDLTPVLDALRTISSMVSYQNTTFSRNSNAVDSPDIIINAIRNATDRES